MPRFLLFLISLALSVATIFIGFFLFLDGYSKLVVGLAYEDFPSPQFIHGLFHMFASPFVAASGWAASVLYFLSTISNTEE